MPMVYETGPYLQLACLCEKVLTEQDGVISLTRVVDRITVTPNLPSPPVEMPPVPVSGFSLVVSLKGGSAQGRFTLSIRPEMPSGEQLPPAHVDVLFDGGPDRGVNVVSPFAMIATQEGLYWIDVLLGDDLLTRIPLRIVYQPFRTGQP